MLTTAVTLHAAGRTDIQSAEQAAEALPLSTRSPVAITASGLGSSAASCATARSRKPRVSMRPYSSWPGAFTCMSEICASNMVSP